MRNLVLLQLLASLCQLVYCDEISIKINVNVPQSGCDSVEKENIWEESNDLSCSTSTTEGKLTSGDGHTGKTNVDSCNRESPNLSKDIGIKVKKTPRIDWKELDSQKGESFISVINDYLANDLDKNYTSAEAMWSDFQKYCIKQAMETLGVSNGIQNKYVNRRKVSRYIKDKDDILLTSNEDINKRWYECYNTLLNEEFLRENLEPLPPVHGPMKDIHSEEVKRAVLQANRNKASGPDGIPKEMWKKLNPVGFQWLRKLFQIIMDTTRIPDSWRYSYIVPIYKNKGDITQCSNYRGIELKSQTQKIWERILNNRLRPLSNISPNQFGFMPTKHKSYAIEFLHALLKKHSLNKKDLQIVFLDLDKAFNRVPQRVIWQTLRAQNVPEHYIDLLKDLYNGVKLNVKSPAGLSEGLEMKVGLQQESPLSPLLFIMVMDYITKDIQTPVPWTLMYVDDVAVMANTTSQMQETLNKWVSTMERFGLPVSKSKTAYMEINHSSSSRDSSSVIYYGDGSPVPKVTQYKYLGVEITSDVNIES